MNDVVFEGLPVAPNNGETLLDALLRHGHDIPNGCRAGICQSCIVIDEENSLSNKPQNGLGEQQKSLGYFYSCCSVPSAFKNTLDKPLKITRAQLDSKFLAELVEKTSLTNNIFRLRLKTDLIYHAGQFVTLWKNKTIARSYSLASTMESDPYLELHIKRYPKGELSQWAFDSLTPGDTIELRGAYGQCFYTEGNRDAPIVLAGIGTGLAPLYGIVREALAKQHTGAIDIILGARQHAEFYYQDELAKLKHENKNVNVSFVSLDSAEQEGDIYTYIKTQHPNMKGYRVFLCGADSFVRKMKKQCFLAGASMGDIAADSFLAASSASTD